MYTSSNDDLFDDSYFQFELLTDTRIRELSGTDIRLRDRVIYFTEGFVNQLYWVDIEKDVDYRLANLFRFYPTNFFSGWIVTPYSLPTFFYNYETLYGYNNNITDYVRSGDLQIRELGQSLFQLDMYKEFRKYFVPKFKTFKP